MSAALLAQVVLLAEKFEVETALDGLEVTRQLKAALATQHIRIVAFTAFAMCGDEAKMRAAGCDGYLTKPIDVKTFGLQVRAYLQASFGGDFDGAGKGAG